MGGEAHRHRPRARLDGVPYATTEPVKADICSTDIVAAIRARFRDFRPCAYLNGTEEPDSFKSLLTGRVGAKGRIYGYVGPKFMELTQTPYHLYRGRYLAYSSPRVLRRGRSMLLLSPIDRGLRGATAAYLPAPTRPPVYIDNRALDGFVQRFLMERCRDRDCETCRYCHAWAEKVVQIDEAWRRECPVPHGLHGDGVGKALEDLGRV